MNICFISAHSFERPGGIRTHLINLSKILDPQKISNVIIAPGYKNQKTNFNILPEHFKEFGNSHYLKFNGGNLNFSFNLLHSLKDFFKKNDFDIIHFHNFLPLLSLYAFLLNHNKKKVLTFHSLPNKAFRNRFITLILHKFFNLFDHVIFVSESQKFLFENLSNYSVISNGINQIANTPKTLTMNQKIKILYVGRNDARKGLAHFLKLIDSFIDNKQIEFHIVGDLPNLSKSNLIEHGLISDEALSALRTEVTLCVNTSTESESFGYVVLESLASATPIIAFHNEGYSTILKNRLEWCLVKNLNLQEMKNKINLILSNPTLYKDLSTAGLIRSKNYSWATVSQQIKSIYRQLLE